MKQYLLSVCYPEGSTQPPPDVLKRIMSDVGAVRKEMQTAGVWVFSGGLYPATSATVLRQQGGELLTTDGPFVESKEQIGGITILKLPDLDAALSWARKLARATTTPIEVRPFMEQFD
ncbi:MAG TPA: YciI family protein [Steroidobacteraceae bacterium]|nr:YciI family protein [Steroidobacteraceae bacterium]